MDLAQSGGGGAVEGSPGFLICTGRDTSLDIAWRRVDAHEDTFNYVPIFP